MKTRLTILFLALLVSGIAQSQSQLDARICMTYSDFVAGNWISVDSLVGGRTKQIIQLRQEDNQYRVKTGDKEADNILRKEALVLEYGGHLYVNCRYLRCNDIQLDVTNYTPAYRYDGDKLCVVAYWINGGALLAGIAGDIVTTVAPLPVSIPSAVGTSVLWLNMDKLNNFRCYYLESDANEKGKTPVTRIADEFMSEVLADSPELLERYKALDKKRARQSAANILPFLKEKGLITE